MHLEEFCAHIVAELELYPATTIDPHDDLFETVGIDSFEAFQVLIIAESLAGVSAPSSSVPEIHRLQDAYDYYVMLKDG